MLNMEEADCVCDMSFTDESALLVTSFVVNVSGFDFSKA